MTSPETPGQHAPIPPPSQSEITSRIPPVRTTNPPPAKFEQGEALGLNGPWPWVAAQSPPPAGRHQPRHSAHSDAAAWHNGQVQPPNDDARAGLTHSQEALKAKVVPQRGWRRILHRLTRINLGLSPDELYERELHARIRRNTAACHQIGIVGVKGGTGRTAVTVALGSTLSQLRGDQVLAVDADPDAGNLADRAGRQTPATIKDLLSIEALNRYSDIRSCVSINAAHLASLASDGYSRASREFNDQDWQQVATIASEYYNVVLADCGAGLLRPAAQAVLSSVSALVVVGSASVDGARQAAVTLDWLRQKGYQHLLHHTCVVINHVTASKPGLDVPDLVSQFERHLRPGRVIVLPWDAHVAAGSDIQLDQLSTIYQRRIVELAAALCGN